MSSVYVPSPLGWVAFSICFFGWAAFELAVNLRQGSGFVSNRDRLSRYAIILSMLAAFVLAVSATRVHAADMIFHRGAVFYCGLALMAAGVALRWVAIAQLGQFFLPEVIIQRNHRLIDSGLYRWVRHPSYTGTFVTVLGYGLALTNWLSMAFMLSIAGLVYAWRVRLEEQALLAALGDDYRAYMRRTKRFIPFLI